MGDIWDITVPYAVIGGNVGEIYKKGCTVLPQKIHKVIIIIIHKMSGHDH